MALILRNGGSQSPDRWLREPRNNHKWILEYHPILIPVLVGLCAVAIFIVCAIIGKLRIILFSLIHLDKGVSWISRRLDKCLEWSD